MMYCRSRCTQQIIVGLVIVSVSLFVVTGIPPNSQEELLAVEGRSLPLYKQSNKAAKPELTPKISPQAQLAAEVAEVVDTLCTIEQELILEQNPNQVLARLSNSYHRIKKLNKAIINDFDDVRWHCEQAFLPEEILQRCDVALQNYLETQQTIFEAIELVLHRKGHIKPKAQENGQSGILTPVVETLTGEENELTLLERVRKSQDILTALKLRAEPDLHNSRPATWEVQQPEAMPEEPFDPNAPSVDVAAVASATPPVPEDLQETMEVQITDEIIEEANELGNSASAIYEFVRNEFEFQPYFGSRKGSVETLRQRNGNDYDLASLMIALLRTSGIDARYATGIVEMPVDRATSWLGVDDGSVAGSILTTMGLEGVSMWYGPELVAVRCRRVWVEAYVSRGRGGGKAWVPLDPAFKLHNIHPGIDIPAEMGLDAQAFIDEYYEPSDPCVILPREETPLDLLKQDVNDYLTVNHPNETVESVKRTQQIEPENLGLLPASLPYKVISRDASYSEIPTDKVYQIRFHLYNGGTTLINETFDLPEIAGKRVTISYVGATPADQDTIDSYDGLLNTPPYLVDIKPVLKVAGQTVAVGAASIGAGFTHNSDIHFLASVNSQGYPQNMVPSIYNNIIAGEYQAVCLGVHGVSNPLAQPKDPCDTEGFMAQLRYASGIGYLSGRIAADNELGELMHCKVVTDVDDAILQDQILVMYDLYGNPQSWGWKGLTVDADRKIIGVWKVDEYETGCGGEGKEIMVLGGAEGSLYENLIFEDSVDKESVSTIKILQLAADQGITIYKRWSTLPLPANTLPISIQNAIASSISAGHVVTFPASQITHGNWTGCGYIDMDDCTGAAGYIISGGHNGGSTVVVWYDWLFVWSSKEIKHIEGEILFPDHDSVYAKVWYVLNPPMFFTYRLRAVFDDDSHDYWRYFTSPWYANIQFQFLPPDHYVVRVGEDEGKDECEVTIFDVEIKKSDETDPPEYLPVKPSSGTVPKESYKAVINPDDLSGDFSWTGSSKLNVKSPNAQTTDVEPAGSDPSSSLKAENLKVTFTPDTPGPFGGSLSDYSEHKMTIFKVDMSIISGAIAIGDGTSTPDDTDICATIKDAGDITLEAKIKPGVSNPETTFNWQWSAGSAISGKPLRRKVTSSAFGKETIVVKASHPDSSGNSSTTMITYIIGAEPTDIIWAGTGYTDNEAQSVALPLGMNGPTGANGSYSSGITIQFTIRPNELLADGNANLFDRNDVLWDVSREKRVGYWRRDSTTWTLFDDRLASWASDDTLGDGDEDNNPWNGSGHLYGNDRPGWSGGAAGGNWLVSKLNMREWVRVGLGGTTGRDGTLSSDYSPWRAFRSIRDAGTNWINDNTYDNELTNSNAFWGNVPPVP